ncbi:MAG: flagellar basal body-associated FliL family protein [Rhodospirillales bacterium]|nr:flagellar basal body-associated FliL family protein [Rhodospirillales bacterium]MDE2199851.1 flagellar basal body-associated FliL family protein [Rhodospirillales bacterium]
MSAAKVGKAAKPAPAPPAEPGAAPPAGKGGRRKLILLAIPAVLAALGAGLWFTGILPPLLGMGPKKAATHAADKPALPVFVEVPEIVANLDAGGGRAVYVKLHARLQIARAADEVAIKAMMPRILDLFQTYLRDIRPAELRGSAGSYRLREEMIARANIAVAPVRVTDVLFTEMLIQ